MLHFIRNSVKKNHNLIFHLSAFSIFLLILFFSLFTYFNKAIPAAYTPTSTLYPARNAIVYEHPFFASNGQSLSNQEVADRFSVVIYARNQMLTNLSLYQNSGLNADALVYLIMEITQGPANLSSVVAQSRVCTAQERTVDVHSNNATMDTGDFCEIHDAIVNDNALTDYPDIYPTEDWFLHGSNGQRLENQGSSFSDYKMNPGNPDWREYFARRALRELTATDPNHPPSGGEGLFIDNVELHWTKALEANNDNPPQEYASNNEYVDAVRGFIADVHTQLHINGRNFPVWGNMISDPNTGASWDSFAPHLEGAMNESYALSWGDGPTSRASLENQMNQASQWISQGNHFLAVAQGDQNGGDNLYAFSAYLMITDGTNASYRYADQSFTGSYRNYYQLTETQWLDYMVPLGPPLGPRQLLSESPTVYQRSFQCGTVNLNITTHTGTINVNATCNVPPPPPPPPPPNPYECTTTAEPQPMPNGCNIYVSPTGTSSNTGNIDNPIDLETALSSSSTPVQPGCVVWLRGGTYDGVSSNVEGTALAPIIVKQYPNERAIVDGSIMGYGGYTFFWGFEITNTNQRDVKHHENSPFPYPHRTVRGPGLGFYGPGYKAINMIIHDAGHPGISAYEEAYASEIYGNMIWGVGLYDHGFSPSCGDSDECNRRGSAWYSQTAGEGRLYMDNISFKNFTTAGKTYGNQALVRNVVYNQNIGFSNGTTGFEAGSDDHNTEGILFTNNNTYRRPEDPAQGTEFGLEGASMWHNNTGLIMNNNYLVNGMRITDSGTLLIKQFVGNTISNNTFVSRGMISQYSESQSQTNNIVWTNNAFFGPNNRFFYSPYSAAGSNYQVMEFNEWRQNVGVFDNSNTYTQALPTENKISVYQNQYEPCKANIVVYNWEGLESVTVEIPASIVGAGNQYEVIDVQNYFGAPVASGTFNGSTVTIPMNLSAVTPLFGRVSHVINTHTAPEFAAFRIVDRTMEFTPACNIMPTLYCPLPLPEEPERWRDRCRVGSTNPDCEDPPAHPAARVLQCEYTPSPNSFGWVADPLTIIDPDCPGVERDPTFYPPVLIRGGGGNPPEPPGPPHPPGGGGGGGGGGSGSSDNIEVTKGADRYEIQNTELPTTVTYTVRICARGADLTNVNIRNVTMHTRSSAEVIRIHVDMNGNSIDTFGPIALIADGTCATITYTISLSPALTFVNSRIDDTVTITATVNGANQTASASATVIIGGEPPTTVARCTNVHDPNELTDITNDIANRHLLGASVVLLDDTLGPRSAEYLWCIIPTYIVIHWSGGWNCSTTGNDRTYETLNTPYYIDESYFTGWWHNGCHSATDMDDTWLMMRFFPRYVEMESCQGMANSYALGNEMAGRYFWPDDRSSGPFDDPHYVCPDTEWSWDSPSCGDPCPPELPEMVRAVENTCILMDQYNIPLSNIWGHYHITPAKIDPGHEFLEEQFIEYVGQICGSGAH